nr:hypothetical protein [Halomicroarcula sp. SHR3]
MGATGGDGGDSGVDSRQLLLVGICIFGLIAAAFLAPVVGAGGLGGDGPGEGEGEGEDGDGGERSSGEPTAGDGNEGGEIGTLPPRTADDEHARRTDGERRRGAEENDTHWVTDEDGDRWRVQENGTRWVSDDDGPRRVVEHNGTRWVTEENGTRWVAERNGTQWVVEENGTRWVSDRNGTQWVAEKNGTRYVEDENGTQYVEDENSTRRPADANDTHWPSNRTLRSQPPQTGCVAVVSGSPKPGTQTTVRVTVDTRPVAGVRVWFNGRFVGRTGDSGAVTGTAPFVTDLNVTVESPTDEPCRFPRRGDQPATESPIGSGAAAVGVAGAVGVAAPRAAGGPAIQTAPITQTNEPAGVNNSSQYDLPSDVTIRINGDPVAGSRVTLEATVAGVAMPNASVAVDGTQVGRTDENGRYELTVPDRERTEVTVSRGEIRGNTTITIPQLSVRFVPRLVVPGERATVVVTRDGDPVENASVALDGQRLGTTGSNGTASFRLPVSGSGTVTAAVGPQSATVPLWLAYWLTISLTLLLAVLTAVTTAVTARWRGWGPPGDSRTGGPASGRCTSATSSVSASGLVSRRLRSCSSGCIAIDGPSPRAVRRPSGSSPRSSSGAAVPCYGSSAPSNRWWTGPGRALGGSRRGSERCRPHSRDWRCDSALAPFGSRQTRGLAAFAPAAWRRRGGRCRRARGRRHLRLRRARLPGRCRSGLSGLSGLVAQWAGVDSVCGRRCRRRYSDRVRPVDRYRHGADATPALATARELGPAGDLADEDARRGVPGGRRARTAPRASRATDRSVPRRRVRRPARR